MTLSCPAVIPFFALACTPETLVNAEPGVNITSPSGKDEIRAGVPFHVVAEVTDDAGAAGLDFAWVIEPEPDQPGNALLTGDEATYYLDTGLEQGEYRITLTATDYAGLADTDEIELDILENEKPTVRIELPEEGATYDAADPLIVQIKVKAKDDEMSNIELFWGGIAENAPDAPSYATSEGVVIFKIEDLEQGESSLEVTARDGGGEEDTESVTFTVR